MARCTDCIHYEACLKFADLRVILCGDEADKKCIMFKPTADVAPRAEWISVEERLPDLYGTYLVYTYDNHIKLGYFCELVIGLPPSFDDYAVTHWMPLPEPPKES